MAENGRIIVLDGAAADDRKSLHLYLKEKLDLPVYYGENLDALYDGLTEISERTLIRLQNPELFSKKFGQYGESLLRVFEEAAEENPFLAVSDERTKRGFSETEEEER